MGYPSKLNSMAPLNFNLMKALFRRKIFVNSIKFGFICLILTSCNETDDNLNLGEDYFVDTEHKTIYTGWSHDITFDSYINFDNYIVIKKKYDGNDIVKKWDREGADRLIYDEDGKIDAIKQKPDTVSKRINETYYYIINKRNNELKGPYSYKEMLHECYEKNLYLF